MNKSYKLRTTFVFTLFLMTYTVIVINLFNIQVRKHIFFSDLGKHQYTLARDYYYPRGILYDVQGNVLATNQEYVSAYLIPNALKSKNVTLSLLQTYFPRAYERLKKKDGDSFMYIKRKLTLEEKNIIEQANNPDIKICKEPHRFYPLQAVGHVVGFVDIDNRGLAGLELLYDSYLTGIPAHIIMQKDARLENLYVSRTIKESGLKPSSVTLTIDADLQFLVSQELKEIVEKFGAQEGAVLIIDPATGAINVMAQCPTFDPNDPDTAMLEYSKNRLVTESYELGSVMKIFVALACLEEGVVTEDELIDCENKKISSVQGFAISTWKEHGLLTLSQVIQYSNNIGIAKVAQRLGHRLYDHYLKLGFAHKTSLGWPGEQSGFITPPAQWSRRSLVSLSFGYEITATLLQLGLAFCALANEGVFIQPRIRTDSPVIKKRIYNAENSRKILTMLEKTVTEGTARKALLKGYTVRGKTGTAKMVVDGIYSSDQSTYTFAGIIEKGPYKRVIVTFIKSIAKPDKMYASSVAVPLFERVAQLCIIRESAG